MSLLLNENFIFELYIVFLIPQLYINIYLSYFAGWVSQVICHQLTRYILTLNSNSFVLFFFTTFHHLIAKISITKKFQYIIWPFSKLD